MPIKVACKCGQKFAAKDELAGRKVKCPACEQPITIPRPPMRGPPPGSGLSSAASHNQPGPLDDLLDEAGLQSAPVGSARCPSCAQPVPAGTILCVHCGYHAETGERIQSAGGFTGASEGHYLLDKAAHDIEHRKRESRKSADAVPWWVYMVGLMLVVGFAGAGVVISNMIFGEEEAAGGGGGGGGGAGAGLHALAIIGFAIVGVGDIIGLIGQIRLLIVAFKDDILQGVLCLFCGPYLLYYVATHWEETGSAFVMWFMGFILIMVGIGLIVAGGLPAG